MKAIATMLLTLLVLGGCSSEPIERIYPEKGLFMEEKKYGYAIACGLENKESFKRFEIRLVVNKAKETVSLLKQGGIPIVEYIEFYSNEVTFEAEGVMYFLNRFTGEITAGRGYPEADGNCIEEGWRWSLDETRNVLVYAKEKPGLNK